MGLGSPGQGAAGGRGGAGRADLYLSPFTWAPGEGVSLSLYSSAVQSPPQPGWEVRPHREQSGLQPLRSLGSDPSLGFPEQWLCELLHAPSAWCAVPWRRGGWGGLDFCLESIAGAHVASLWGISPVGSTPQPPPRLTGCPLLTTQRCSLSVPWGHPSRAKCAQRLCPPWSWGCRPGLDSQASAGTRQGFI